RIYFYLLASKFYLLSRSLGHHLHLDRRRHATMQLDGEINRADSLDRLGELQLAPIDVEALLRQRLGDVGRGDRAVQRIGLADPAGDDNLDARQPVGDRLRDFLLFRFLRVELGALPLYLLPVAGRHRQGQLAREQVVARVAVGDLHDLAAIPEVLDV